MILCTRKFDRRPSESSHFKPRKFMSTRTHDTLRPCINCRPVACSKSVHLPCSYRRIESTGWYPRTSNARWCYRFTTARCFGLCDCVEPVAACFHSACSTSSVAVSGEHEFMPGPFPLRVWCVDPELCHAAPRAVLVACARGNDVRGFRIVAPRAVLVALTRGNAVRGFRIAAP